jgi:hypothetical protein
MGEWDVYFSNVEEGLEPKDCFDLISDNINHIAIHSTPIDEA